MKYFEKTIQISSNKLVQFSNKKSKNPINKQVLSMNNEEKQAMMTYFSWLTHKGNFNLKETLLNMGNWPMAYRGFNWK